MTSKTFCVAPFMGVEFRNNGQLTPCCRYTLPRSNSVWNFREYDKWWNEYLTPMREELLNGIQHTGCKNCWRDEEIGIRSYRQNLNDDFINYSSLTSPLPVPTYQMYNYGNFCNLKCVMCSPFASSQIETEYKQNIKQFNSIDVNYKLETEIKWFRSEEFESIKNKLVGKATQILIQGGEPFLSPDVLELLASSKNQKDISLTIISNLTTFTDEITELLKKFNKVNLVVSLEGIGIHNDYVRHGSNWNEFSANIDKALCLPNIDFKIAHTFQRTSLIAFIPLLKWAMQKKLTVGSNILDYPNRLSVISATDSEKQTFLFEVDEFLKTIDNVKTDDNYYRFLLTCMKSDIEKIKNYVESTVYDAKCNQDFWNQIDLLDGLRNTDFTKVFDKIYRTQVAT